VKTRHTEPTACYPSAPVSLCTNCQRSHIGEEPTEAQYRIGIVIDASIAIREGNCAMFAEEFPK
jgi:hypothetical protein